MICSNCKERPVSAKGRCNRCYVKWYYHTHPKYKKSMIEANRRRRKRIPNLRKIEYQKAKQKPGYMEKERLRKYLLKDKVRFGGNRQFVLKRDKHRCVVCNKIGNIVHHKDLNPLNNDVENLITCCQSHHMKKFHRVNFKFLKNYKHNHKGSIPSSVS